MRGSVLGTVVLVATLVACSCGSERDPVTGVLDAPEEVSTLLHEQQACAFSLDLEVRSPDRQAGGYRNLEEWVFAPGATLTVEGRPYTVLGGQARVYAGTSGGLPFVRGRHLDEYPRLQGFSEIVDTILLEQEADQRRNESIRLRDRWIECGADVRLRGWISGDYVIPFRDDEHLDAVLAEHGLPPRPEEG